MFRFWSSDPRGSETTVEATLPMPLFAKPVQAFLDSTSSLSSEKCLKRRRPSINAAPLLVPARDPQPAKRIKTEACRTQAEEIPEEPVESGVEQRQAPVSGGEATNVTTEAEPAIECAKDVIQFQLGLEILYKHDELRLINQELAKCQIALEQLRRCHLIPYPVTCPTPEQMVQISSGKGPAVRNRSVGPVPEWAPPFGVVDGPYARHYAKWLIPDPKFDGVLPEWQGLGGQAASSRSAVEGRTTRNSYGDSNGFGKQRPARGMSGHKLHSLSAGYPQPKDKAGPCVLKRSDGKTVKLVCIDCHRENFSSTQGFINHCRIAHKRDFKSHEEAAVHCGHPIEVDEAGAVASEEKPIGAGQPPSTAATGLVYPYARVNDISEQEAFAALKTRLQAALRLYHEGKSPNPPTTSTATTTPAAKSRPVSTESTFVGADDVPHLSHLLKSKNFTGDFRQQVADAKTKDEMPEMYLGDEDSEDGEQATNPTGPSSLFNSAAARAPGVMRMPARVAMAPSTFAPGVRPTSSKGCASHMSFETPLATPIAEMPQSTEPSGLFEDEMDVDLSPNTTASNNAPSLVSDDGEYDDSDDGSSSDVSDNMDTDSVTEIKLEDDHEVQDQMTPRALRKGSGNSVGLKKDESRHVTFVSPVRGTAKGRKSKQAV